MRWVPGEFRIMPSWKRLAAATLILSISSMPAFAAGSVSPAGSWQSTDGLARVRVTMCGDGTQLCARLTGLSGAARTPENVRMLNSYVVAGAQRSEANVWLGAVHFGGQTAEGHIAMRDVNDIVVSGCQLGICKTMEFRRVSAVASRRAPVAAPVAATAATAIVLPQMPPRTVSLTLSE
jgi:hypothetical protein